MLPGDTARVQLFLSTPSARRATSATFSLTTIRLPFLSTPSARRATGDRRRGHQKHQDFYPRPPRGGRPSGRRGWRCTSCYFYPRPPRGGRHLAKMVENYAALFLSTPSARRATAFCTPRESSPSHFYPRPPRGGRLEYVGWSLVIMFNFYPRPPRGGRRQPAIPRTSADYFYPRPPRGGRQQKQRQNLYFLINYTTFCTNLEEL